MPTIKNLQQKYFSEISPSDLEILISHAVKKPREFILAHPEYKLSPYQVLCIKYYVRQRNKKRPIAYIIGHKEFYGLDFKVNKNVLIPRPETEQIVELVTCNLKLETQEKKESKKIIIDIGTGCGNIIISVASILDSRRSLSRALMQGGNDNIKFYATDISSSSLRVAHQNAKIHKVDKKIKFLKGNLLGSFLRLKNKKPIIPNTKYIILSNLPYLSKKIYNSAPMDVKEYEPKSALYSKNCGLFHYEKLFQQIKKLRKVVSCGLQVVSYLEFSPEQKNKLAKLIKDYFPRAKTKFKEDLAGKWRICRIEIS